MNNEFDTVEFNHIADLKKGYEAGSSNYLETETKDSVHYIRVGDLDSLSNTFVIINDKMPIAKEDDILVAFDGAPGRNAIGLNGVYSSGIYKVKCSSQYKGLAYFELNSNANQRIISDHSQGTTILHASKAIPFLISIKDNNYCDYFNKIFNGIVNLKKKINLLKKQKNLLLDRYFTSQQ